MFGLKIDKNKIDLSKLTKIGSQIDFFLEKIVEFLCVHIINQVNAGADVVQIFDSWAGLIPEKNLFNYCYEPNRQIIDFCKKNNIPTICFPKGIKEKYVDFAENVKPDCLSLDYEIDPIWAKNNLNKFCLQGGMNPEILFKEENEIFKEVDKYLNVFKGHPYIFNLGHGLLPETNPEILKKVLERVVNFK